MHAAAHQLDGLLLVLPASCSAAPTCLRASDFDRRSLRASNFDLRACIQTPPHPHHRRPHTPQQRLESASRGSGAVGCCKGGTPALGGLMDIGRRPSAGGTGGPAGGGAPLPPDFRRASTMLRCAPSVASKLCDGSCNSLPSTPPWCAVSILQHLLQLPAK